MLFQDLGLAEQVQKAVAAEGYTTPTPIQEAAIPHIMEGRDLIGTAQTGTGKTAAFALPILHRLITIPDNQNGYYKPRVLVLSPTRELATQISDSFQTYGAGSGMRHVTVYGGVSQVPQVKMLRRGVDIIVATPGRLLDLNNQRCLQLDSIEMFVLDEADRMLDMGFLPDIRRIIELRPAQKQTMLFSATMPPAIERLASELLRNPADVRITPKTMATDLVTQHVFHVDRGNKPAALASYLTSQPVERAVVFTRTKQSAERVATRLSRAGLSADSIHGNKTQNARQRTLNAFRSNRVTVLVATDVAARGLDVDGVSHVVNYDLPQEPETYVHRIGRTGRAGANGIAMSFVDREQRGLLGAIERLLRKKIPVQAIEITDQKPAFAVAGSPPSPVATTETSAEASRSEVERPQREYRERGERPSFREKREGGYQGRRDRTEQGSGERRSYGNREGGRYENRSQGDRPAYGKKFGSRPKFGERQEGGDRPRYGERRENGDRPQYGNRPHGKKFSDRPGFVRRARTEQTEGNQPQNGDAAPQAERRFERRPAGDRPRGRFQQEGRGSYGDRPRRDGEGRPAYGDRKPGRKFPPKRFEGQRQSQGKDQRPRRHDDAAAVLPPAERRRETRETNGSESTGFRPKRKTPIMKKKRHRQEGSGSTPSNGSAAPRRYENGSEQ
jgi:ATP-dependent RNA helicase RhlE